MSTEPTPTEAALTTDRATLPPPRPSALVGMADMTASALDELTERRFDEIEMLGEEDAAGYHPPGRSEVSAGMRYLHCSRTIHQLVTDRNRVVGMYLAVASLLWTASTALLNVKPEVTLRIPIQSIQMWCLPVTWGTLTILALFAGLLLIRTRVGMIYEVAKMNLLLGLPVGRVKRVNFFSLFFIMHLLISLSGGGSAILFALYLLQDRGRGTMAIWILAILAGVAVSAFLVITYIVTVLWTTTERKLNRAG